MDTADTQEKYIITACAFVCRMLHHRPCHPIAEDLIVHNFHWLYVITLQLVASHGIIGTLHLS